MWSHYGDSHKGICLVYELEEDSNGVRIELEEGQKYIKPIKYGKSESKISVFENIGNLSYPTLERKWLYHKGENSKLCQHYTSEGFHSEYWKTISEKTLFKFKDWEYEEEYRIVDYPMFGERKSVKDRLINYEVSQLKGIIFGLKTPDEVKFQLMNEADKMLTGEQRKGFEFYQVRESNDEQELEIHKFIIFGLS